MSRKTDSSQEARTMDAIFGLNVVPVLDERTIINERVAMCAREALFKHIGETVHEHICAMGYDGSISPDDIVNVFLSLLCARIRQVAGEPLGKGIRLVDIPVPSILFPLLAQIGVYQNMEKGIILTPCLGNSATRTLDQMRAHRVMLQLQEIGATGYVKTALQARIAMIEQEIAVEVSALQGQPMIVDYPELDAHSLTEITRVCVMLAQFGVGYSMGLPKDRHIDTPDVFTMSLSLDGLYGTDVIPSEPVIMARYLVDFMMLNEVFGLPRFRYALETQVKTAWSRLIQTTVTPPSKATKT